MPNQTIPEPIDPELTEPSTPTAIARTRSEDITVPLPVVTDLEASERLRAGHHRDEPRPRRSSGPERRWAAILRRWPVRTRRS